MTSKREEDKRIQNMKERIFKQIYQLKSSQLRVKIRISNKIEKQRIWDSIYNNKIQRKEIRKGKTRSGTMRNQEEIYLHSHLMVMVSGR